MNEFSDIANYLLEHHLKNRIELLRKYVKDKMIYDGKPITVNDLYTKNDLERRRKMKLSEKFIEKDIIVEVGSGLGKHYKKKKEMIRMVVIKYKIETKKGKAIGQILDGVRRLL